MTDIVAHVLVIYIMIYQSDPIGSEQAMMIWLLNCLPSEISFIFIK